MLSNKLMTKLIAERAEKQGRPPEEFKIPSFEPLVEPTKEISLLNPKVGPSGRSFSEHITKRP
jgi:hypothetical protein